MFTFSGLALLFLSYLAEDFLRWLGIYDDYVSRPTDWFVIAPFIAGLLCLTYVFFHFCNTYLV